MISITCKAPSKKFCIDIGTSFLRTKTNHRLPCEGKIAICHHHVYSIQQAMHTLCTRGESERERTPVNVQILFCFCFSSDHATLFGLDKTITLACSNSSRSRTPAPSPMTNPSRFCLLQKTLRGENSEPKLLGENRAVNQ